MIHNPFSNYTQDATALAGTATGSTGLGDSNRSGQVRWAPAGGPRTIEHSASDQVASASAWAAGAAAIYTLGPHLIPEIGGIGGVAAHLFEQKTGFDPRMPHAPLAARGLAGAFTPKGPFEPRKSNKGFWYDFAKRMENVSFGGGYLSDIFNIFSRVGYVSETLSPWAERGSDAIWFDADFDTRTLDGAEKHRATQQYLDSLGVKSDAKHFAWKEGAFHEASLVVNGLKTEHKLGRKLVDEVILQDRGRLSQAKLTLQNAAFGTRTRDGKLFADKVFANSSHLPMKQYGSRAGAILHSARSYAAMGMARTSNLLEEMGEETENLVDFILPGKGRFMNDLRNAGIFPRFNHGTATEMAMSYSKFGAKAFALMAVANQAGHFLQEDGAGYQAAGGLMHAGIGAVIGRKFARLFGESKATGGKVGGLIGGLSMFNFHPLSDGIIPGIAQTMGGLNVLRAQLGEITGANKYRRWLNETMPGLSEPTTAIGLGLVAGAGFVAARRTLRKEDVVTRKMREDYLRGLDWKSLGELETAKPRISNGSMRDDLAKDKFDRISTVDRAQVQDEINEFVERRVKTNAEDLSNVWGGAGLPHDIRAADLARSLTDRQEVVALENALAKPKLGNRLLSLIDNGNPFRATAYAGMAAAAALWMGTGQFASLDRAENVRAKNRGDEYEVVKRAQKWEMGSQEWQGQDTLYYRPTWIARASSGATQRGSSGRGMLSEWLLSNFTYQLERESYNSKPAPITGAAFEGVPFIYPLIKPFADLIKPAKLMHVDEWAKFNSDGDIEYLERGSGLDPLPVAELGGLSMQAPQSPYSGARVLGKTFMEWTNAAGLVGFNTRELKNITTGSDGIADQRHELQSWHENIDLVSRFYDQHSGGTLAGAPLWSEPVRRFLVKRDVENYNVIENNMPSWMPEDFQYGNPHATLRYGEGEWRMPGEGFAALFPELKGVDPENYGDIYKNIILGDVAHWSGNYRNVNDRIQMGINSGEYTERQIRHFVNQNESVKDKVAGQSFDPYLYNSNNYENLQGTVDTVNSADMTFTMKEYGGTYSVAGMSNKLPDLITRLNVSQHEAARIQGENARFFEKKMRSGQSVSVNVSRNKSVAINGQGHIEAGLEGGLQGELRRGGSFAVSKSQVAAYTGASKAERSVGAIWENLSHDLGKATAPLEYMGMFGLSPIQKTMGFRDPIEEYEAMHLYGKEMRLWQKPLDHWFKPSMNLFKRNWLGMDGIPKHIQQQRDIQAYFDQLQRYKYQSLEQQALSFGDMTLADEYGNMARNTLAASDGYVGGPDQARRIMGGAEEKYAFAFFNESDPRRRARILDRLPENKARFLQSYYNAQEMESLSKIGSGINAEGYRRIAQLQEHKVNSQAVRQQEAARFESTYNLPEEDWIGFNPSVDLEDVKLRYLNEEALDFHDHSIYPSRAKMLIRKPYVDESSARRIMSRGIDVDRLAAQTALGSGGINYASIRQHVSSPTRDQTAVRLNLEQLHDLPWEAFSA